MDKYSVAEESYKKGFKDGQASVLNILKILISQSQNYDKNLVEEVECALCRENQKI